MATELWTNREPEVAKFIDSYKFDQDMAVKRDKFGGGTSLPLNSDGYDDKQRHLRDERHSDWLVQMDKGRDHPYTIAKHIAPISYGPQSAADYDAEIQKMTDRYHKQYNEVILNAQNEPKDPVYYRVAGAPEQGFPGLGEYDKVRQEKNVLRQKEYNDMLRKQRQSEKEKLDARRHAPPPRPAQPSGPQVDYNAAFEQSKAEDRRAYQDYMGKYESSYIPWKQPLDYEESRKILNEERKRDYNEMMDQGQNFYSVHAPQKPVMDYWENQKYLKLERNREYNELMKKGNNHYPINAPQRTPIDYKKNRQILSEERKQEYNQLMEKKAKEERYWAMRGRPVTPPGGLNIGSYDRQVKEQAPAKKQEYKKMLDEQKLEQLKLRAMDHVADVSPKYVGYREQERPLVGSPRDINYYMQEKESKDKFRRDLRSKPIQNPSPSDQNLVNETSPADDPNYKAFIEVEQEKLRNKRKYAEELLQQQREHMFLRARQEPEMAVLDRNGQPPQFLANKPPPGPSYGRGRDEPSRQTPAFWNEGRLAQGPGSLNSDASRSNRSSAYVPMAYKTESQSRPIPERASYGQPPHPGSGLNQNSERFNQVPNRPPDFKPMSPEKPIGRELLHMPVRDDERPPELGTPMAFKTEPRSDDLPTYEMKPYPGPGPVPNNAADNRYSSEVVNGRPKSPANLHPRSPEKPANVEWLKRPMRDDERPPGVGTPLAFKTNSYSRQPPPAPEQGYSRQPPSAPEQGYSRQALPTAPGSNRGPPPSSEPQRLYKQNENGVDGLYGRSDQSREVPRSRRSLDAERKFSPSKREGATKTINQISPRRMKNALYTDSEEVSSKRREASKERQKEYNDFLKIKAEQRRHDDDTFRQQVQKSKPAEVVKNPFYSSDDYEKFQRELQKKQGEEYREFLSQSYQPPPGSIGLPIGQYKYEPKRLFMEAERNFEWNKISKEQYQPGKDAQGLPIGQYRYEPKRLQLEAERNKDYNELLQKQLTPRNRPAGIDGPQGLNIDVNYHLEKQNWLEKQRNKDYNDYLKKGEEQGRLSRGSNRAGRTTYGSSYKQSSFNPHVQTPPRRVRSREHKSEQMSEILTFKDRDERPPQERGPPMQNGYTQNEQQYNAPPVKEYQEQNGYPMTVSEPGDYKPRMPDYSAANPDTFHQQMTAPYPKASSVPHGSPPATPSKLSLPVGQYDDMRPFIVKQRNKEYNYLKDKFPSVRKTGMTPRATDVGLPIGQYDKERPHFEKQRNVEYNELIHTGRIGKGSLRQKIPTPPNLQGLPIGQQNYEPMYREMEHQRNREYNEFLQKKYGGRVTMRSTRSEPGRADHPKSSFYYGNEMEQNEKKKMLNAERRNEYHTFMKEQSPPRSKSIDIPSDVDSGLPIGQQHHEAWRQFLRGQRKTEYNQLVDMKKTEVRNRGWNFEQNGVLELHGDDAEKSKQRELRAERQQDYNAYISQIKAPTRRTWPEPEGRGALLVRKGEYDNVRQMYDEERKRDFVDRMQKRREMGLDLTPPSAPAQPLQARYEYFNPMINVLGRYDDFRKKLVDDRKREFRTKMDQVKEDDSHRRHYVSTAPTVAREETPLVYSMGTYELETKNKMRAERKKELADYVHEQQKHWTPRTTVKENLMPHVAEAETPLVNYMGQYDKEKLKYRVERNKDLRDFEQKKKKELRNPYENYVYPTVAVAEKPIVDYMGTEVERRKRDLREERIQDYENYKKQVASHNQKMTNPGRRHDFVDTAAGPYGGLFHGLGEHGNRSDDLNRERQKEYNDRLDQQYAGKDRPSGRPKWAHDSLPNNTDRGRSPMKTQPPADQYEQMLNEKRREEANLRRFEDPEYQDRLSRGRDRGEDGPRYNYH